MDRCGMSAEQVAKVLTREKRQKVTRSAVLGIRKRIMDALKGDEGIGDGTMPPRWWDRPTQAKDTA